MNGATVLPNATLGLELGSLPSSLRLLVLGDPGYVNLSASPMLFYAQIMFALCHMRLSSGLDFLMRCVPFAMWIACDLFSHKDGCKEDVGRLTLCCVAQRLFTMDYGRYTFSYSEPPPLQHIKSMVWFFWFQHFALYFFCTEIENLRHWLTPFGLNILGGPLVAHGWESHSPPPPHWSSLSLFANGYNWIVIRIKWVLIN